MKPRHTFMLLVIAAFPAFLSAEPSQVILKRGDNIATGYDFTIIQVVAGNSNNGQVIDFIVQLRPPRGSFKSKVISKLYVEVWRNADYIVSFELAPADRKLLPEKARGQLEKDDLPFHFRISESCISNSWVSVTINDQNFVAKLADWRSEPHKPTKAR